MKKKPEGKFLVRDQPQDQNRMLKVLENKRIEDRTSMKIMLENQKKVLGQPRSGIDQTK
jgi:hypothetical protein